MAETESVTLATGAKLPLFGLGTWLSTDPAALTEALRVALDAGYRLIDTAYVYGNEEVIGRVLHEYFSKGKLKREEVFITTKLPFYAHEPADVEKVFHQQLKSLQLDYVDLYLIHTPCCCKKKADSEEGKFEAEIINGELVPVEIDHAETWKALEKLYKEGKAKAIGLSNFNEEQIENILNRASVQPHNLQVEAYIYWPQHELYEFCKKNGITFTAYAPIGSPGRKVFNPTATWPEAEPMKDPLVIDLSKKYKKTPAQILLRHMVQRGISTIPKSTNPDRIRENINIFDFKLSVDEVEQLNSVKQRVRLFVTDFFAKHPYYPFKDVDKSTLKESRIESF